MRSGQTSLSAKQHFRFGAKIMLLVLLSVPVALAPSMAVSSAESELASALRAKRKSRCPHLRLTNCNENGGPSGIVSGPSVEIRFAANSATVATSELAKLAALADMIAAREGEPVQYVISGHADASGQSSHNQRLSALRASMVRRLLIEQYKVLPHALKAVGFGNKKLKNSSNPFAAENRRVSIEIGPPR